MGYIVTAAILLVFALVALGVWRLMVRHNKNVTRAHDKAPSAVALVAFVIILMIFGGVTIGNSITTVEARSVAVQTSFGQYTDTLENGLSLIAPWSSTEEFTTQVQFTELSDGDGALGESVKVNFNGGSTGNAAVVVRWAITEEGAESLWRQHQTFERVENNLVASSIRNSTINVYANYTPVQARGEKVAEIPQKILEQLEDDLGSAGIKVDSVAINDIRLDDRAQAALNRIVDANSRIEEAEAAEQQAIIDARTAGTRQAVLSPEILQQNCLDILANWDQGKSGPVPATFNCNFGETGQTPVIVGQN